MPIARACPYYSKSESECVNCLHGAFHECTRYRRELAFRRVSCLGKFVYEPTGFGVDAHRHIKVVWSTDSLLLKRWILEDSIVGRFSVIHMDMVEVKTLVLDEEGSYDDRIDGLGVSINNGGGIYLDLRGVVHGDVYDRGNTMFSVMRDFVFLCVSRGVRVYIDCGGDAVATLSEGARGVAVGQNVFMSEFMCGGVGYRLMETEDHNLLVETPESKYLRCGIGGNSLLLGTIPWSKWLIGKGRCRYVVSDGKLSDVEKNLMLTDGTDTNDTIVGMKSASRVTTTVSSKTVVADTSSPTTNAELDFVEKVRNLRKQKSYSKGKK